jgi:ArsR family metal-binding transcriptional regulator
LHYIDSIALVHTTPCLADPGKIIVTGKPSHSLGEVIPYLATLPDVIAYNPETLTLTFRRQIGFLTLYLDRVYITKVRDVTEGLALLDSLTEAINATWIHRDELVRVNERRIAPRPLDIFFLLPQMNCKECGEATCMAYAVGLLNGAHSLEECAPLWRSGGFAEQRAALSALI